MVSVENSNKQTAKESEDLWAPITASEFSFWVVYRSSTSFISAWIQLPLNSPHSEGKQQTVHLLWANYFIQSSASVPIQFPPLVKTATVILFSWFQMLSCSSDDLAKFHWYLQMNRPLRNTYTTSELVPQKHFDRATVWRPAGWNA